MAPKKLACLLFMPINRTWSRSTLTTLADHSTTPINGAYFLGRVNFPTAPILTGFPGDCLAIPVMASIRKQTSSIFLFIKINRTYSTGPCPQLFVH